MVEYVNFESSNEGSGGGLFTIFIIIFLFLNLALATFIGFQYTQNPALFDFLPWTTEEENNVALNPTPAPTEPPSMPNDMEEQEENEEVQSIEGLYRVQPEGSLTVNQNGQPTPIDSILSLTEYGVYQDGELVFLSLEDESSANVYMYSKDDQYYIFDTSTLQYVILPVDLNQVNFTGSALQAYLGLVIGYETNLIEQIYQAGSPENFNYRIEFEEFTSETTYPLIIEKTGDLVTEISFDTQSLPEGEGTISLEYSETNQSLEDILDIPEAFQETEDYEQFFSAQ